MQIKMIPCCLKIYRKKKETSTQCGDAQLFPKCVPSSWFGFRQFVIYSKGGQIGKKTVIYEKGVMSLSLNTL